MQPSYQPILYEWSWARALTSDLLRALSDSELHAQPIAATGSWGKQFRHLGRVQENYIQALRSGITVFSPAGCTYVGPLTKEALLQYLARLDQQLLESLLSPASHIDWFGEKWSVERHLQALVSHEILHHGQLILYARVAGFSMPKSWEAWGE